jgi:hypothetical protein
MFKSINEISKEFKEKIYFDDIIILILKLINAEKTIKLKRRKMD